MKKRSISLLLILLFLLFPAGCRLSEQPYEEIYSTLVDQEGNFQFFGAKTGMTKDEVINVCGLDTAKLLPDSSSEYILKYQDPLLFEELGLSFQCYFYFTPDGVFDYGEMRAFLEGEEVFSQGCDKVIEFVEARLPACSFGSLEALKQKQVNEENPDMPQWKAESEDTGSLSITLMTPGKHTDKSAIRFRYRSQLPAVSFNPADWQDSLYDTLVTPDGNYSFRGIQKGMTMEQAVKMLNLDPNRLTERVGLDWWLVYQDKVYFPELGLSFYMQFRLDEQSRVIESASYYGPFEMTQELLAATETLCAFITEKLPAENVSGSVSQLRDAAAGKDNSSVSWSHQAADGTTLSFSGILGYLEITVNYTQ